MPKFVFGSQSLTEPTAEIAAEHIDEVLSVLEFAERESNAGSYVALMLSYEAAPAFDPVFAVHEPSQFPLAWAAAFSDISDIQPETRAMISSKSWTPRVERDEYDNAVTQIRELIAAGDTYQVNYCFPITSTFSDDHYAWFRSLCLAQGAEYSAYIDLGRYKILCVSPELFFKRRGNQVITKPMKGTMRRGRWSKEDEGLAQWLKSSIKDRAENVMIVDLLRNDLGKVSIPGSVHVSSLFDVERFETVWQMTSTVESTLRDGTTLSELLQALFPCGSITGAPKIRTMEIIRELERFPRGVYTGAIGLLQPGGDCIFNVAIRTVVIDTESNEATFGVGGGITIDSTAEQEYEECLVKSQFLHSTPVEFQLFESILLEDGEYFLLPQHLERLKDSAEYFGFGFPGTRINADLERIKTESGCFKVRLTLWKDGRIETQVTRIELLDAIKPVSLATEPVDSSDPFLFHKTTRPRGGDDVIFWNERSEVTESSIANVVVRIDGELFTPPIECGLLPGVFRNHLLSKGTIKERVITIEEFKNAKEFFLINSVRKWIRVIRG
ncbi:MAG TPA: aminodeoxychorismate synthase component I [Pyrinomonadaceae bacterium]|jgi:para-aminobenzoate synthetase/4-amino-4-deoxychorismate lyase|nr:aminodeoxychorismate synthase component I [Pyrinomonadaceae bacterium]